MPAAKINATMVRQKLILGNPMAVFAVAVSWLVPVFSGQSWL
jgi:hypothetical protein